MIHTHSCPACGALVQLELLDDPPATQQMLAKLASIQMCDSCIDHAERDAFARRELANQTELRRRIDLSGIPKGLQGLQWDSMRTELGRDQVIDAVRSWCVKGGSLFLYSRPGPGKTRLAATAAWELVQSRPLRFVQAAVLITKANASFGSQWREQAEQMVLGHHALILDDLGKESPTDFARQLLQAALDERIANDTHLLITSNLKPSELGARYGDWLASRLGAFEQYHLPGPDLRLELT